MVKALKISAIGLDYFHVFAFIIFIIYFIIIYKIAMNAPVIGIFDDDMFWLLPSLASDMDSGLTITQQFARDVGERGAISLNSILRLELILFGNNPNYFFIFNLFLHLLCAFLFYILLMSVGFDKYISFSTSLIFFTNNEHFHAYFWGIGIQHIIALISIFTTFILTKQIFTKPLSICRLAFYLTLISILSFNRASVILNVVSVTVLFFYACFIKNRHNRIVNFALYVITLICSLSYPFFQYIFGNEGWQVKAYFNHSHSSVISATYINTLLVSFAVITILSLYFYRTINNYKLINYQFAHVILIFFLIFILQFDRDLEFIPTLIENMFYAIPNFSIVTDRWAHLIRAHGIDVQLIVLLGFIPLLFISILSTRELERILLVYLIFQIMISSSYLCSLKEINPDFSMMPSRYAYYFTPGIILVICLSFREIIKNIIGNVLLRSSINVIVLCFFTIFSCYQISSRAKSRSLDSLFSTFPIFGAKILSEAIREWSVIHNKELNLITISVDSQAYKIYSNLDIPAERIPANIFSYYFSLNYYADAIERECATQEVCSIYPYNIKSIFSPLIMAPAGYSRQLYYIDGILGNGWNPIISSFIDPPTSKYNPTIFALESFLKKNNIKTHISLSDHNFDFSWCDDWLCFNNKPLHFHGICNQFYSDDRTYFKLRNALEFWNTNRNIDISRSAARKIEEYCNLQL